MKGHFGIIFSLMGDTSASTEPVPTKLQAHDKAINEAAGFAPSSTPLTSQEKVHDTEVKEHAAVLARFNGEPFVNAEPIPDVLLELDAMMNDIIGTSIKKPPNVGDTEPLGNTNAILPGLEIVGKEIELLVIGDISTRIPSSVPKKLRPLAAEINGIIDAQAVIPARCGCPNCSAELRQIAEVRAMGTFEGASIRNVNEFYYKYLRTNQLPHKP